MDSAGIVWYNQCSFIKEGKMKIAKGRQILDSTKNLVQELHQLQQKEHAQEIQLKRRMSELMAIRELGKAIRNVMGVDELAKIIVKIVTKKLKADTGSIMLIDRKKNLLTIVASAGIAKKKKERYGLKIGEGLAGWCVQHKVPVQCFDMEKDPRFKRTSSRSYLKREYMGVPLLSKNSAIGVFNIEKPHDEHPYTDEDIDLLCTFIDETVASFENALLFENIQQAYYDTIRALVIAMESKDPYMYGHGERVGKYAVKIAKILGLPKEEIKLINFFSILHDIGKIGVPQEVLAKPTKLTTHEWELIRKHPTIGESIIEPIEFLQPVRTLLRHHHEWYNGRGYPDKLKGEDIAIAARILSVADAYDAMQSDRPYRKALPREKAIQEIKRASGTQFDPKVVDALIKTLGK